MKPLLLIAIVLSLLTPFQGSAQVATPDSSKTYVMLTTGMDVCGAVKNKFGFVSPTISLQFASKLKRNFELTYGIDLTTYRFQGDVQSYWEKHPGSSASLPKWYQISYQKNYTARYFGIPIQLAYMLEKKKWSPYFSAGILTAYNFREWSFTNYLYDTSPDGWGTQEGSHLTFFATAQAGFIKRGKQTDLRMLFSANQYLYSTTEISRKPYSIGFDIGIRRKLKSKTKPSQTHSSTVSDTSKLAVPVRKNTFGGNHQLYVEGFGPGMLYSINYEGRLARTPIFAFYFRAGLMLLPLENGGLLVPQMIPISLTATLGKRSNFEFGAAFSFSPTNLITGFVFSPMLGFRVEGNNRFVFRIFGSALVFVGQSDSIPFGGISIGKRFGK